eukprot:1161105-Pelagomonas_calceolata.AAC.16
MEGATLQHDKADKGHSFCTRTLPIGPNQHASPEPPTPPKSIMQHLADVADKRPAHAADRLGMGVQVCKEDGGVWTACRLTYRHIVNSLEGSLDQQSICMRDGGAHPENHEAIRNRRVSPPISLRACLYNSARLMCLCISTCTQPAG